MEAIGMITVPSIGLALLFLIWLGWLTIDQKWIRRGQEEDRKRIADLEATVRKLDRWAHDPMAKDLDLATEEAMVGILRSHLDSPTVNLEDCKDKDGKIQIAFKDPMGDAMRGMVDARAGIPEEEEGGG